LKKASDFATVAERRKTMDFGKISDKNVLDRVQFDLPSSATPQAIAQLTRLRAAAARNPQEKSFIQVGLPIWGESQWVGTLYPASTRPESFLREYAKQFSCVEVNSTFYGIPPRETLVTWQKSVGASFRFCPKFPQTISREVGSSQDFGALVREVSHFAEAVQALQPQVGPAFLQLPPNFQIQSLGRLNTLLQSIPKFLKTVVEFRHESFFEDRRLKDEVIEVLARNSMGTALLDTAAFRNLSHTSFSATRIMVRFLGSDLHSSDYLRLDQWVDKVVEWHLNGMKEIYFFLHQPDQVSSAKSSDYFIKRLNKKLIASGALFQVPEILIRVEEQESLF
jgi:uncharacterized protein YecE (DUF72 family)